MIKTLKLKTRFTFFLAALFVTGFVLSCLLPPSTAQSSSPTVYEFDNCGSSTSLKEDWTFETEFQRNFELQWYQEDNAFCENGKLILEGRQERRENPCYGQQTCGGNGQEWKRKREWIDYTSASLISQESWQYGRFEVKAKIQTQDGLWPAIWFTGVSGEWPGNGEIDLMEYYGDKLHANLAWGTAERWVANWAQGSKFVRELGDPATWDNDFHIWRMDWDSNAIALYVDDTLLKMVDLSKVINPPAAMDRENAPENPFRQPHNLRLNLAIGGDQGSDKAFRVAEDIPNSTAFPTRYEIEYIRIYPLENS